MTRDTIRHLTRRPGKAGRVKFVWIPGPHARKAGWTSAQLGYNETEAIAQALKLNRGLDAWRAGKPAEAPKGVKLAPPSAAEAPGTLAYLIEAYRRSDHFPANPKTAKSYNANLELLARWGGDQQAASITPPKVQRLYSAWKAKPHQAAALVSMLRILYNKGRLLGIVGDENPAAKAGVKTPQARDAQWPEAAIEGFIQTAAALGTPSVGAAVLLSAEAAQRQTDCLRLAWTNYEGDALTLRQSKTGRLVKVPASARLRAHLAAMPRAEAATTIVVNERTGRPYTEQQFQDAFDRVRVAAEAAGVDLAGLQFRDLRRTGICNLALAQIAIYGQPDIASIAAVSGHEIARTQKIIETYLPRMEKVAAAAITALDAHRRNQGAER